jgi:hypothetical protein
MSRSLLALSALLGLLLTAAVAAAQDVPLPPPNHYDFARTFVPTPGRHHVVVIHPGSGAPVQVSFSLPHGIPQVRTYPRRIIFDYGTVEVEIHFAMCGLVQVHTRLLEL